MPPIYSLKSRYILFIRHGQESVESGTSSSTAATELEVFGHELCEPKESGEQSDEHEGGEEEDPEVDEEVENEDEIDRLVHPDNHQDLMSGMCSWDTDASPDQEETEPTNGQPETHPDQIETLPMELEQSVESQWRLDLLAEEARRSSESKAEVSQENAVEAGEEVDSSQDGEKTANKDCNEHPIWCFFCN